MEWIKAKNILIVIFVMLNIFLAVTLINSYRGSDIPQSAIDNTLKVLKQRGVAVDCELPLYNKQMGTLIYENTGLDKEIITKKFLGDNTKVSDAPDKGITQGTMILTFKDEYSFTYENSEPKDSINKLSSSEEVEKYIKDKFKEIGIPISDFSFDRAAEDVNSGQKTYIYRQKYKECWIYKNEIALQLSTKGISSITCRYRQVNSITKGKKIIPAYQVLLKNFIGKNNITINKVDIGYVENVMEEGTKTLDDIPAWRVQIFDKDKGEYDEPFFKAYTGEMLEKVE